MRSTGLEHVKMHARKLLGFLRNSTLFWNNPQDVLHTPAPGLSTLPPVAVSVRPWHQRLKDGQEGSGGGGRGLEVEGDDPCAVLFVIPVMFRAWLLLLHRIG